MSPCHRTSTFRKLTMSSLVRCIQLSQSLICQDQMIIISSFVGWTGYSAIRTVLLHIFVMFLDIALAMDNNLGDLTYEPIFSFIQVLIIRIVIKILLNNKKIID